MYDGYQLVNKGIN